MPDREQILIVDDDEDFATALARAMRRRGFAVAVADCPREALAVVREQPFQHIVLDLRLGEESGLTLIPQLLDANPSLRVVVLTGYASVATAVEAIKLGAVHYLAKPTEPDRIVAAFERDRGDPGVPPATQPMSPRRLEWEHLQRVLRDHGGNISAAARALGMHRRTLQRKLAKRPVRR